MTRILLALSLALAACGKSNSAPPAPGADATHIPITVDATGFAPAKITVKKDVPTTLVFTRTTDDTCAKAIVVDTGAQKIQKDLPLNQPVEIAATFAKPGDLQMTCSMNMVSGTISVQ
jgi:plastocyanin domain-containing protein